MHTQTNPYLGVAHLVPDSTPGQPGCWAVHDPRRWHRPLADPASPCGLCPTLREHYLRAGTMVPDARGEGGLVAVWRNNNPILDSSLLAVPFGDLGSCEPVHKEALGVVELATIQAMVLDGVAADGVRLGPREALAYVNPTVGSGRSQAHGHWHLCGRDVPMFDFAPGPAVCGDGPCRLRRAEGVPFAALVLEGGGPADRAATLARVGRLCAGAGFAYNLAFWCEGGREEVKAVVLPRAREYVALVDQRVGALELLTAVFLPGPRVAAASLTAPARDRALADATLSPPEFARLSGVLRGGPVARRGVS